MAGVKCQVSVNQIAIPLGTHRIEDVQVVVPSCGPGRIGFLENEHKRLESGITTYIPG